MPAIPAAYANLPAIVIAERIAQGLMAHDRDLDQPLTPIASRRSILCTPARPTRKPGSQWSRGGSADASTGYPALALSDRSQVTCLLRTTPYQLT